MLWQKQVETSETEVAMHNLCLHCSFLSVNSNLCTYLIFLFDLCLGCMLHFSQAVDRKVQGAGLATAYLYEVSFTQRRYNKDPTSCCTFLAFTKFVRILCLFLPLNEVAISSV